MKVFFISRREFALFLILVFFFGLYVGKITTKKSLTVIIRHVKNSAVPVQEIIFPEGYGYKEID